MIRRTKMRELILCFILLVAGVCFGDPAPPDVHLYGGNQPSASQRKVISNQKTEKLVTTDAQRTQRKA